MSIPTYSGLEPLRIFPGGGSLADLPVRSLTRLLLALSIYLTGCERSIPFEKNGWQKKFDGDYPNRDAMVQDLLDNHQLTGLATHAITELLGEEDHITLVEETGAAGRNYMTYQVLEDFGWDIDPVHTKYLVLEFNDDSVVTNTELLEWKQR
jgi:hypothetical protein